jgi:cytochrome c551/c552
MPRAESDEMVPASNRDEMVARGRILFQERGCLACHTHVEFADAESFRDPDEIVQGPDLSGIAAKFDHAEGRQWLYRWVKDPLQYDPRTLMPETFLDPIVQEDGSMTDPAADLVEYLMANSQTDWQPDPHQPKHPGELSTAQLETLDELTLELLRGSFSAAHSERYLALGIPTSEASALRGAEAELSVAEEPAAGETAPSVQQKLRYVGRKALTRYGCFGCHDIPGLEDAKPIGISLADWGRKPQDQLSFENIAAYLRRGHPGAVQGDDPDQSLAFFQRHIEAGHRVGFIFQKLREPRSYDYRRAENKSYHDRLRMPQFSFDSQQREAIITFVLGLVADPPRERFLFQPEPRTKAILAGREILQQYRCTSCHVLATAKWDVAYEPGDVRAQPVRGDFPFLGSQLSPTDIAASRVANHGEFLEASLRGLPRLDIDGLPMLFDEDGLPVEDDFEYDPSWLEFPFDLWDAVALDGNVHQVGVLPLNVRAEWLTRRSAPRGGFLSKYLLPRVVQRERQVNPSAKGSEAWGWLPPSLVGQGNKVQSEWLHEFLLNPTRIRPAIDMRMPRYNLSRDEATKLAHYFAAQDGSTFPYTFQRRQQAQHLQDAQRRYRTRWADGQAAEGLPSNRFDAAMQIVTDSNFCIKCHRVGDFDPEVAQRSKAPDLAQVHERLQPEYLKRWIANPTTLLPYTGMPVNIPFAPDTPHLGGIRQDLFPGTSLEQLDALVDLLMNYGEFAKQQNRIAPLVEPTSN